MSTEPRVSLDIFNQRYIRDKDNWIYYSYSIHNLSGWMDGSFISPIYLLSLL